VSKVILQGYIIVPEMDLKTVTRELVIHTKLTRAEEGCLTFEVTVEAENPNKFNVYEEFINQNAFDKHQLRVKNSNWGVATARVERHYQISAGT